MNILIVYTHPNKKSFNHALQESVEKTLIDLRHDVRIRDLYEEGFDPVLSAGDLQAIRSGNIPSDIKKEQEHVSWADALVVIHPVWWTGLPAVMKGYIDRVFSFGFAYTYENGTPRGLLTGKKVFMINTTGAPYDDYAQAGMHEALKRTSDEGIYAFCGMDVIGHVFFGAVPVVSDEVRRGYLSDAVKEILFHFGKSS